MGSWLSWTGPPAPAELPGKTRTGHEPPTEGTAPLGDIRPLIEIPVTFLMEPFFLVQDYQFAVLVGLLQHVLTLLDVTVIVL